MHPSPSALATMTNDELNAYRADVRELWHETDGDAYKTRMDLIDAILSDRKRNQALELDAAMIRRQSL